MTMAQKPEGANSIFVLGLLSILLCGLLGPIAWVQGNTYMSACRERGVEPEGLAVAGRIMGIIAVILMGVGLLVFVITILTMIIIAMVSA